MQELAEEYLADQAAHYDLIGLQVNKCLPQQSSMCGDVYKAIHPLASLSLPKSEVVLAFSDVTTGEGIEKLHDGTSDLWWAKFGKRHLMTTGTIVELRVETADGVEPACDYVYLATLVYPGAGLSVGCVPDVTEDRWSHRVSLLVAEYDPQEENLGDVVVASPLWVERRYQQAPAWVAEEAKKAVERARVAAVSAWRAKRQTPTEGR